MHSFTFLGHDNASLSMLIESLYQLYQQDVSVDIVTILHAEQLNNMHIPYTIEGINCNIQPQEEWIPALDTQILLGTMVAKIKQKIFGFFHTHFALEHSQYSNLIYPGTHIAATSKLQQGISIGPGSVLAPYSSLGNQVSINRNVSIGHHTKIHNFATLNPGCNIAGFCDIGEGATIGMGANVIDGKKVGKNSTIGAGSLVTKDIPDNVVAYGVPAKVIRDKNEK